MEFVDNLKNVQLVTKESVPRNLLWVQSCVKISSPLSEASSSSTSQEFPAFRTSQKFITFTKKNAKSHLVTRMRNHFWRRKYMATGRD